MKKKNTKIFSLTLGYLSVSQGLYISNTNVFPDKKSIKKSPKEVTVFGFKLIKVYREYKLKILHTGDTESLN